jgi:hypothetical protein
MDGGMQMTRGRKVMIAGGLMVALALALAGCTKPGTEESEGSKAAAVEPIGGSDVARITLSPEAEKKVGIRTGTVQAFGNDLEVIPFAALFYDPNGKAWVYTSPQPRVFVRAPVTVEDIRGGKVLLSSGPPPGTAVVTVGAAELLGTEYEVGEE